LISSDKFCDELIPGSIDKIESKVIIYIGNVKDNNFNDFLRKSFLLIIPKISKESITCKICGSEYQQEGNIFQRKNLIQKIYLNEKLSLKKLMKIRNIKKS